MNWDETSSDRPARLSPWEIELSALSPMVTPSPTARNKRFRSAPSPLSAADLVPNNSTCFPPKHLGIVQGEEPWMGVGSLWRSSLNRNSEPLHLQRKGASGAPHLQIAGLRTPFCMPFSPPSAEADSKLSTILPKLTKGNHDGHGGRLNFNTAQGSIWPLNDFHAGWATSVLPLQAGFCSVPMVAEKSFETVSSRHSSMFPPATSFPAWERPLSQEMPEVVSPALFVAENSCKLFGVSLTDTSPTVAGAKMAKPAVGASVTEEGMANDESQKPSDSNKDGESFNPIKSDTISEPDIPDMCVSREADLRSQAVRSCTKVIKKGSMVGRGIDLSKIDSYKKLNEELESMFHMEGELANPDKGWQVAYSDNEGDFMHVGDDPWPEFCQMVCKLHILSPEEVHSAGLLEGKGLKQGR